MPTIRLAEGLSLHCAVDDYLWPWEQPTPVLMMHGFARNATFWNRWVPAIAKSRRIYRPDLLGCGASDVPASVYRFTPEKIEAEIVGVFEAMALSRVHWVKPELVVEVTYLSWTEENLLRQVSYQGEREDKPARQVVRAIPHPWAIHESRRKAQPICWT